MRFLMLILAGLFFISCKEEMGSSRHKDVEAILNDGNWRLVESEQPFTRFQEGLKFSEDNQVFMIDSQGQLVMPMHKRLYTVLEDTLKLVDYRYEDRFIYSRGTDILIIEELTADEMVLKAIHPNGPNKLIFHKFK
jgi:hypothetical protein